MPVIEVDRIVPRIRRARTGCWEWTGATNGVGYGMAFVLGRRWYLHRFMYERCVGPIPKGLVIDHLCRNTLCCNPEHLEPVTQAENIRRSPLIGSKAECIRGHPFDATNTYTTPAGARACRACKALREQARRARARRH